MSSGNPWRIRHTGIYHLAQRNGARSVLFIIHPNPSAHFKNYLQQTLLQPSNRSIVLSNPMLIHSMLISTHLISWRDYLDYHETQLLQLVNALICGSSLLNHLLNNLKDMKPACTSVTQSLVTFDTLKQTCQQSSQSDTSR